MRARRPKKFGLISERPLLPRATLARHFMDDGGTSVHASQLASRGTLAFKSSIS